MTDYLLMWLTFILIKLDVLYSPSLSILGESHKNYKAKVYKDSIEWTRK